MAVMDIRDVWMSVLERCVRVSMSMRFARRVERLMLVLVVLIVDMTVLMLDGIMLVDVLVSFTEQ